jgi:hypothetical protein
VSSSLVKDVPFGPATSAATSKAGG